MKYVSLFGLLGLSFWACDQKRVDPVERPLIGTYAVTHLKQFQNGQLVFDGDLPAVLGDTVLIKHGLSIDLSSLKSSTTDAFISYHMVQSRSNADSSSTYSRSYGRPIANNQIKIVPQSSGQFGFYTGQSTLLGSSDGSTLSFNFTEPDSLGHPVRYIYEAIKSSARPSQY